MLKIIRLFFLIIGLVLLYSFAFLPGVSQLDAASNNLQIRVVKQGNTIKYKEAVFNLQIAIKDIPKHVCHALIAMEDRNFYHHFGFDLSGIARAVFHKITKTGHSGGSTLTQQLARQLFLSGDRVAFRKIKEILLAIKIEIFYTKREILEMYINRVPLGNGTHGIEAAARYYFQKRAMDLNLYESALLVGSIPSPNRWNYENHKKTAIKRANLVLKVMKQQGYINSINPWQKRVKKGNRILRRGDYISLLDSMRSEIIKHSGDYNGTLVIVTTIDPELQVYAELAIKRNKKKFKQSSASEAALIAMTPDGAIKALVGSIDRRKSTVNHAIQAKRQLGSTFKPFVYLTALKNGWKPNDKISGRRINIRGWHPKNANHHYPESITLMDALAYSSNTATVRLMEKVGRKNVIQTARQLGLNARLSDKPSLALGTGEGTLINITGTYSTFANEGRKVDPYKIVGIRDKMGTILYWRKPKKPHQIVSKKNVRSINKMLRKAILEGTGKKAALPVNIVAGKTGTTQSYRDAWFIGYSAYFVTGVWVGNRDNRPMKKVSGSTLPAEIWRNFMTNTHSGFQLKRKPLPGNVY